MPILDFEGNDKDMRLVIDWFAIAAMVTCKQCTDFKACNDKGVCVLTLEKRAHAGEYDGRAGDPILDDDNLAQ